MIDQNIWQISTKTKFVTKLNKKDIKNTILYIILKEKKYTLILSNNFILSFNHKSHAW